MSGGNKIDQFVIDNYLPVNFNAIGTIKEAKNAITLINFKGEQLNLLELYFLYDLEASVIVPPPLKPGYVCFWSDLYNYDAVLIEVDGRRLERLSVSYDDTPECFSAGMVCRIMKPGNHVLHAEGRGAIDWHSTFEVKANMCLTYRLGKQKRR